MPSIITKVGTAAQRVGSGLTSQLDAQFFAAAMRVKYLLEFTNEQGTAPDALNHAKHMPLPHVVAHDYTRNHAQNTQWGMGEAPVIEYSGVRDARVVLRGCSGIEKRTGTDSRGAVMYKRGYDIFKELVKWVQKYEELQHAHQSSHKTGYFERGPSRYHLRLHALTEGITYYGEIESFTYRKDSQRYRFSYEYTLTLRVFKAVNLTGKNVAVLPADDAVSGLEVLMGYTEKAAAFADMSNNLGKTVAREVENFGGIMDAFDNVSRGLANLSSLGKTARETVNFAIMGPTAALLRMSKEAVGVVDSAIQLLTFGNQTPEVERAFYDAYRALSDAERDAAIAIGGAMVTAGNVTATPGSTGLESVPVEPATSSHMQDPAGDAVGAFEEPTQEVTSQEGQTLEDLLQGIGFSDADITVSLIDVVLTLNNMPDKTTMGSGKSMGAGDTIVLPIPATGGPATVSKTGGLYRRDLLLGPDGDLVLESRKTLNAAGHSSDIDTLSWGVLTTTGPTLIKQAIRNRLLTEAGQNSPFPAYGLPTLVGEKSTGTAYGIIAAAITEQLGRDPRVTTVTAVDIVDVGDGYEVDCVAETPYGTDLALTVPLQV